MVHSSGKKPLFLIAVENLMVLALLICCLKGLTLANSLIGVFLRFRLHLYALVGDIKKMNYQCCVLKPFQDFLRFL